MLRYRTATGDFRGMRYPVRHFWHDCALQLHGEQWSAAPGNLPLLSPFLPPCGCLARQFNITGNAMAGIGVQMGEKTVLDG